MKRVLLISHSQKSGGAERCLYEAAISLQQGGFEVVVLMPSKGELYDLFSHTSIDVIVSSHPWWVYFRSQPLSVLQRTKRLLSLVKYTLRLVRIIKKVNPHVVLSNTLCIPCGALAAKILHVKHNWFIHEYGEEDHGLLFDFGLKWSSKIIDFTTAHVYVNSKAIEAKFNKFITPGKFSLVNYNVTKPKTDYRVEDRSPFIDKVKLFLIGQVAPNKGQRDAISALKILRDKGYNCSLNIIGQVSDMAYYEKLKSLIATECLSDSISFISHTSEPYKYVKGFSIGLMCSEYEALGRVTVEYMKLGIPVVGSRSSTTATLINEGVNGLLYTMRDPHDLAAKIERYIKDPNLEAAVIEGGVMYANTNFNNDVFTNGLAKFLL